MYSCTFLSFEYLRGFINFNDMVYAEFLLEYFLHVLFIRCSLNLYNKNPEKVNEILHRIICVFTAAFLYNYVANTFNLYFIPLTKILTMGSIYEKELLYIVSMLTIPLSVSAISEELKFNYLGKPVSSSNGYSPMYLQGIYASRDTFGMRQSAVVASFKANSKNPFSFPVLGINSLYGLVDYKDRDSVALYADNTAPDYNGWEILSADKITPTSILSNSIDPTLIKPGMIIETKTNPKWTTYVISVTKGKIITSGWVNMQTRHMGYPKAQTLLINPLTKIWAANFNITIPENSRAVKGVVQENGIVNNKINNGIINGIDTVILPYSKYGGSSAYVARSANTGLNQQWENGFYRLVTNLGL